MTDHTAQSCKRADAGVARVFELFGKRWTGLIVATLMGGGGYFAELRRAVPGISERMLSDRLTELAAVGLVSREVDAGPPLRVFYRLTKGGDALEPALKALGAWAETYLPDGGECPDRFRS
ncbi:winged helix-turn-helix transcriptional regulator [Streptomyces zagrosensis]|uniref:DNA-binding HxlR family transcriptional regulator n=1 Tax=Streptomyces zagrosensis TaxID=1042984 RepID=A0A7W9Q5S4_9ACTN|nr:helix-turn-helix domain-containing protein [Streptomyces zagrosensis]MBB5934060.1 DNA-binding HxlR family transcriptional regulator [Streptomyces zagrosensis]